MGTLRRINTVYNYNGNGQLSTEKDVKQKIVDVSASWHCSHNNIIS